MSFLDLFQKDQAVSVRPRPNEGRDLPVGFGDAFTTAWNDGALFGQSTAYLNARTAAAADYATEIAQRTGDQTLLGAMATDGLAGLNRRLAVLRETHPDIQLLTDEDLDRRGLERSTKAHAAAREMAGQEKSLAGKLGGLFGGFAGAASDPINIVALPVAPAEGIGLLATSLRWGAITGVSQTAIELAGGPYHERVQPGYAASGAPLVNIVEAAGGGAVIGGGFKVLGNLWTRYKSGAWPQSVRDAGNIIESEANVANTNVYPGLQGEVAHRTALQDSIENLIHGRPINVERDITPSVLASYNERLDPLMAARAKAIGAEAEAKAARDAARVESAPQLPFAPTAKEFEAERAAARTMGEELQALARSVGHDMPADEAAAFAARLAKGTDAEALAVLDEFMLRPRTLPATLPSVTAMRNAAKYGMEGPWLRQAVDRSTPEARAAMAEDLTPARAAELRADPEVNDIMLRDLDRLRAEKGEIEIPFGEMIDAAGERVAVKRSVESILAEADSRELAAREIAACVGPQEIAA